MAIRPEYDPMEREIRAARKRLMKPADAANAFRTESESIRRDATPPRPAQPPTPATPEPPTVASSLDPRWMYGPSYMGPISSRQSTPAEFNPAQQRVALGQRIADVQNDLIRRQIQGVPFDRIASLEHIAQLRREYAALDASQRAPQAVLTPQENINASQALAAKAAALAPDGSPSPSVGWMSGVGRLGGAAGMALDAIAFSKGAAASAAQQRARQNDIAIAGNAAERYRAMRDQRMGEESASNAYDAAYTAKARALGLSELEARRMEAERRARIAANPQLDSPRIPVGPEAEVESAKATYLRKAYEEAAKQIGVLTPEAQAEQATRKAKADLQMQDIEMSRALPQYEGARRGVEAIIQTSGKIPRGDAGFRLTQDIQDAESSFDAMPDNIKGPVASELLRRLMEAGIKSYEVPGVLDTVGYGLTNYQDLLTLGIGGFIPGSNRDIVMARVAANRTNATRFMEKLRRYANSYAQGTK